MKKGLEKSFFNYMIMQNVIRVYKLGKKLQNFKWIVSNHPAFISDLAPSDYYLFGLVKNCP